MNEYLYIRGSCNSESVIKYDFLQLCRILMQQNHIRKNLENWKENEPIDKIIMVVSNNKKHAMIFGRMLYNKYREFLIGIVNLSLIPRNSDMFLGCNMMVISYLERLKDSRNLEYIHIPKISENYHIMMEVFSRKMVAEVLSRNNNNKSETARVLGIDRKSVARILDRKYRKRWIR